MKLLKPAKKSLGQNFLIDKNIINKIINIPKIEKKDTIMEIGPGYGSLTEKIIKENPKKIYAIEKDKKIYFFLKKKFENNKNLQIVNDDILNVLKKKFLEKDIIVFGNLPYNISTQILSSLIHGPKNKPWYKILIFMFQKEVAQRIVAKSGEKDFGRLAILANWSLDIKKHFYISKNCFFPKPKIDSAILSFTPKKKKRYNFKNSRNLETVTRVLFSARRKMINKNFLKLFNGNRSVANNINLDLSLRPEKLSNEMFYKITMEYEKLFD
tara:strand:+ start:200 stop:1006 length:807 start_codon:yes stop_codon:yes gene_type:complete